MDKEEIENEEFSPHLDNFTTLDRIGNCKPDNEEMSTTAISKTYTTLISQDEETEQDAIRAEAIRRLKIRKMMEKQEDKMKDNSN